MKFKVIAWFYEYNSFSKSLDIKYRKYVFQIPQVCLFLKLFILGTAMMLPIVLAGLIIIFKV
jgi:uncharacterized membrane protein